MNFALFCVACAIVAYLFGSINTALIIGKITKKDIRSVGSGNPGATNVVRAAGMSWGVVTFVGDALKGVVIVLLSRFAQQLLGITEVPFDPSYIVGACTILGHDFPIYHKFKGGKGVATSLLLVCILDWRIGLTIIVAAVLIIAVERYISLAAIAGSIMYPILMLLLRRGDIAGLLFSLFVMILLIIRHKDNMKRLMSGTEGAVF